MLSENGSSETTEVCLIKLRIKSGLKTLRRLLIVLTHSSL